MAKGQYTVAVNLHITYHRLIYVEAESWQEAQLKAQYVVDSGYFDLNKEGSDDSLEFYAGEQDSTDPVEDGFLITNPEDYEVENSDCCVPSDPAFIKKMDAWTKKKLKDGYEDNVIRIG